MVREVLQKFNNEMRVQGQTIEALRESSEMFLVQMFTDAYLAAKHANRVTLQYKDIHFIKHLMPPTVYYWYKSCRFLCILLTKIIKPKIDWIENDIEDEFIPQQFVKCLIYEMVSLNKLSNKSPLAHP